jgi:hypothetical protein
MTNATTKQVTAPQEVLEGKILPGGMPAGLTPGLCPPDIDTSAVLSTQEQAIVEGKKVLRGTATERILRIFEAIRSSGPPRVALERAIYFTESFNTTEGQPLVLLGKSPQKHCRENVRRHL